MQLLTYIKQQSLGQIMACLPLWHKEGGTHKDSPLLTCASYLHHWSQCGKGSRLCIYLTCLSTHTMDEWMRREWGYLHLYIEKQRDWEGTVTATVTTFLLTAPRAAHQYVTPNCMWIYKSQCSLLFGKHNYLCS